MIDLNLSDKTALVCGASQGIGKACALELAALGANVVVLSRNAEKLEKLIVELPNNGHQHHRCIDVDLSDIALLQEKLNQLLQKVGTIEILINNAGGPALGPIELATNNDFQQAFDMHLKANVSLVRALLPGMKAANYGRIINITSTSVKTPLENLGVSNTTRWAVAAWAKTLSYEVAKHGITVNTILPGSIKTERNDAHIKYQANKNSVDSASMRKKVEANIPAGYIGKPEEVAQVVAFIASPAASYVNGTAFAVDGGRTHAL